MLNHRIKVGGIYTVLRSKAPISTEELGDQYCALGPLREERWRLEVEPIEPESRNIRAALKKLNEGGFKVNFCATSLPSLVFALIRFIQSNGYFHVILSFKQREYLLH